MNAHFRYKDFTNNENYFRWKSNKGATSLMSIRDDINSVLEEFDESALLMDGFDEAIVGFGGRPGTPTLAIYDWEKMVDILITRDGMEYEEAVEYISYNCTTAWVGEQTPIVMMIPFHHRKDIDQML